MNKELRARFPITESVIYLNHAAVSPPPLRTIEAVQSQLPDVVKNIYPWLRIRDSLGVEVRMCKERNGRIDLDEFFSLIDSKTRIVAISQVQYASGFRADLERIGRAAHLHDALLVVDVSQSDYRPLVRFRCTEAGQTKDA
jgi:hypothetical protein